jgi:hypothetical protein
MPQPFKRRGRPVRMAPSVVAERGGGFAVLIGLVATHWSKIEQSLGMMYTWLLMGQEPSAFELYHKLVDLNLKETAFMAAAEGKLPAEMIDEVKNLYIDLRRLSGRRAKIIHGTWCTTPTKPLSLLLADPRDVNQKLNELLRYVVDVKKDKSKLQATMEFPITPDEFQEYHARDFQALMTDLVAADNRTMEIAQRVLAHALERVAK